MQVSVVIPVYNAENYMEKCLDSVMKQTFRDFEVIVVDDGSTDRSGEICDRYEKAYENIRVFHTDRKGAVHARKLGAGKGTGTCVAFIDADDWIEERFLEILVTYIRKNNSDIVISGVTKEKDHRDIREINPVSPGYYCQNGMAELYKKMLYFDGFFRFGIQPYLWNKLFKRELLLEVMQDLDEMIYDGEDAGIVFPYLLQASSAEVIEECPYHYILHSGSVTGVKGKNFYENTARLYLYLKKKFMESGRYDILLPQLDQYMRMMVWQGNPTGYLYANQAVFPFDRIERNSRVVLYGAGLVGKTYYMQIRKTGYCSITAWTDQNYDRADLKAWGVKDIPEIGRQQYDYLVIAIENKETAQEIQQSLIRTGVPEEKIIY